MIFVAIAAPLLTILLYEAGLDEFVVKEFTRWHYRLMYIENIEKARDEFEKVVDQKYPVSAKIAHQDALSRYPVRKLLWRVRASIYLLFSLPLYIFVPFYLEVETHQNGTPETIYPFRNLIEDNWLLNYLLLFCILMVVIFICVACKNWKSFKKDDGRQKLYQDAIKMKIGRGKKLLTYYRYYTVPVSSSVMALSFGIGAGLLIYFLMDGPVNSLFLATLVIAEIGVIAVNMYRYRSIFNYIVKLTDFSILYDLMAIDSKVNAKDYQKDDSWKQRVLIKLESLDSVLVRGDWPYFISSWSSIRNSVLKTNTSDSSKPEKQKGTTQATQHVKPEAPKSKSPAKPKSSSKTKKP